MAGSDKVAQHAHDSLELLYEVSREVASAQDLHTVLQRVLFLSMKNVGAIRGSILVLDEHGKPVDSAFLITGQSPDRSAPQLIMTYEKGLSGWVAQHHEAVLIADTSKDARWMQRPDDARDRTGSKSALSVPVMASDELVGVMTLVHPKPDFFTHEHLELVGAIADQAGVAIRNTRLHESLQSAHKRYRELFEDSIDPILITDHQGLIVELNRQAEKMLGWRREQIGLANISDLNAVDWAKTGRDFKKLTKGSTINYESVVTVEGGREIPVQVSAREIQNEDEPQLQWILRDISERKDLDQMREDLIAMVYHDLRSPLANIVSSLEILVSLFPDSVDDSIHSLITIALRSTERIQRLTNSLLDINRLEQGQEIGNLVSTDVESLILEALEAVLPTASSKDIEITWDIPADHARILVDADMIRRVLINLLENAVKFTPSKGKIHVSLIEKNSLAEFSVSDTGHGISEENQVRIFEKFTRLTPQEGSHGLGLGLAFCRLAVQAHGGEIWVESGPGLGAKFKFTVPLVKKQAEPEK